MASENDLSLSFDMGPLRLRQSFIIWIAFIVVGDMISDCIGVFLSSYDCVVSCGIAFFIIDFSFLLNAFDESIDDSIAVVMRPFFALLRIVSNDSYILSSFLRCDNMVSLSAIVLVLDIFIMGLLSLSVYYFSLGYSLSLTLCGIFVFKYERHGILY